MNNRININLALILMFLLWFQLVGCRMKQLEKF